MSMDPEYDRVATLDHPNGQELLPSGAAPVVAELPAPVIEAPAPVAETLRCGKRMIGEQTA